MIARVAALHALFSASPATSLYVVAPNSYEPLSRQVQIGADTLQTGNEAIMEYDAPHAGASVALEEDAAEPARDANILAPTTVQSELFFQNVVAAHVRSVSGNTDVRHRVERDAVSLVVSLFVPDTDAGVDHPHFRETYAAFAANVNNPLIDSIHVLLQTTDNGAGCGILADKVLNAVRLGEMDFSKVHCTKVDKQPTYSDFFEHANDTVREGTAMIANADIVFDETLDLLEHMNAGEEVAVLSSAPPPYAGQFADVFRSRCRGGKHRCKAGTISWDAFVFRTPLPAALPVDKLRFYMNINRAEYRVASALKSVGFKIKNPCMHINAHHWHCFAGKTHSEFPDSMDVWRDEVTVTHPCRDYPEDCSQFEMPKV